MSSAAGDRRGWRRVATARWVECALAAIVVLAGLVVAGTATGTHQRRIDFRAGAAWLASDAVGQVALVDGASAKVITQVAVGRPGLPAGSLRALQSDLDAYVVDDSAGVVGRISGATYTWNRRPGLIAAGRAGELFVGSGSLYLVDGRSGVVTTADPASLAVRGRQSLAARVGPDGGVVDTDGRLWLIDAITGNLVWLDGTARHDRRAVAEPARTRLVLAGGHPAIVELAERRITPVSAGGRLERPTCLDIVPGDASTQVAGAPDAARVYAAVGTRGVLMVADLAEHRCRSVVDLAAAGHELGAPVEVADRVFVPDFTSGAVHVVDLAGGRVLAAPRVLPAHRRFGLQPQGGFVFYNDPAGSAAGVIRVDGSATAVRKYGADTLGAADGGTGDTGSGGAGAGGDAGDGAGGGAATSPGGTGPTPTPRPTPRPTPTHAAPAAPGTGGSTGVTPGPARSSGPPLAADRSGSGGGGDAAAAGAGGGATTPAAPPNAPQPGAGNGGGQPGTGTGNPPPTTSNPPPDTANPLTIEASTATAATGAAVTFRAATDGPAVTTATWTFDDGGTASGARTTHAWTNPGRFAVTVNATLADGRTAAATAEITITAGQRPPPPAATDPTARIELTPGSGDAPLSVTARASASIAGSNPITGYSFAFGDGATATGEKATHTFAQAGDYTVTVTVTDSAGRTSKASATAHVTAAAAVGPTAQLSASRSQATAPADIVADASASTAGSSPIATYAFTFSDGTTVGPQASPTARHQVTAAGTYTVTVTVRDQAGRTSPANASVTVTAPASTPPRAALISDRAPAGGVGGYILRLDASGSVAGSAPITSYRFDFGDGTVMGPQADPTSNYHEYMAGTYRASVTVTDQSGQQATASITIDRTSTISLSKRAVSSSPGGTEWEVTIGNIYSPVLVRSVSGSGIHNDGCSGRTIGTQELCTVEVSVPSGTPSSVITVVSTAKNSPASIELVS